MLSLPTPPPQRDPRRRRLTTRCRARRTRRSRARSRRACTRRAASRSCRSGYAQACGRSAITPGCPPGPTLDVAVNDWAECRHSPSIPASSAATKSHPLSYGPLPAPLAGQPVSDGRRAMCGSLRNLYGSTRRAFVPSESFPAGAVDDRLAATAPSPRCPPSPCGGSDQGRVSTRSAPIDTRRR